MMVSFNIHILFSYLMMWQFLIKIKIIPIKKVLKVSQIPCENTIIQSLLTQLIM